MSRRVGGAFVAGAVVVLGLALWSAPASAQSTDPCLIASLDDGEMNWQAATSPSRALPVSHDATVLIAGPDPGAAVQVEIVALGGHFTVFDGQPESGVTLVDVGDYARWGVGLYDLRVRGGCSADVWVHVTGRSPLTTPAGIGATIFLLVGLALVVWSIVAGNGWRAAFGGVVFGLGLAVLLQQFGVLPLTVVPLMLTSGGAAAVSGTSAALAQRAGTGAPADVAPHGAPPDGAPPPRPPDAQGPGRATTAPVPSAPGGSGSRPAEEPAPVLLGASAPSRIEAGREATLRFLAYREDLAAEIERRVEERSPGAATRLELGSCRWRTGTPVTVTVSAKGLDIAQGTETFEWDGRYRIVEFDAEAPAESTPGTVVVKYDVAVEGIVIARLRHDLDVTAAGAPAGGGERGVRGVAPARTAFASYASQDRQRVLDRVAAIRNYADVDVWLDTLSLHPGEEWKQVIETEIRARDVFVLFWSSSAAASSWVEWEWRSALREKAEASLQVQPLEPPKLAPPPPELAHLHFGDLLVDLRLADERIDQSGGAPD